MPRNYKREYKLYHGKPAQVKRRAARNSSRAAAVKAGRARKGDGKDVDHKDHNPKNKSPKNIRIQSKSTNRARNLGKGGRPAKRKVPIKGRAGRGTR